MSQHLDPERLAALADDAPSPAEGAHLALCGECRRELDAHRTLFALAAGERERAGEPLTSWEAMAPRLEAEGLLKGTEAGDRKAPSEAPGVVRLPGSDSRAPSRFPRWAFQAAAAILIAVASAAAGRWSARTDAGAETRAVAEAPGAGDASLASNDIAADGSLRFGSVEEAQAVLSRAERDYRLAMGWLATNDTTTRTFRNSDMYRARLAALDAMAGAAREGVNELPHDPVINQAYLSTLAAREATLRQLDGALPQGVRLTGF